MKSKPVYSWVIVIGIFIFFFYTFYRIFFWMANTFSNANILVTKPGGDIKPVYLFFSAFVYFCICYYMNTRTLKQINRLNFINFFLLQSLDYLIVFISILIGIVWINIKGYENISPIRLVNWTLLLILIVSKHFIVLGINGRLISRSD